MRVYYCPFCQDKGHKVELYVAEDRSMIRCTRCIRDLGSEVLDSQVSLTKKGKLLTCTVHNRTKMEGVDKQLFTVGKPKGTFYMQWFEHDPGLAPSKELITFTKEHNRKGHLDGWFDRYTESLLDEWSTRKDTAKSLNRLVGWLSEGKIVAVSCYCAANKRGQCHLSVLGEIIEDLGFDVEEAEPVEV